MRWLTFILALAAFSATAQDTHKCKKADGSIVFQDSPCPKNQIVRTIAGDGATSESPASAGQALCLKEAPGKVAWKDPASIQILGAFPGKMQVIDYHGVVAGARLFYVRVNAKNSYGGYTGEKSIMCFTSEDGRRLLKIDDLLL